MEFFILSQEYYDRLPSVFSSTLCIGTYLQSYIDRQPSIARGVMLWASYLWGRTADLASYPTPIMHLSGDLDGQVKITTIAKPFR